MKKFVFITLTIALFISAFGFTSYSDHHRHHRTPTPYPTYTAYPTYTPQPTYTPYPTYTKPAPPQPTRRPTLTANQIAASATAAYRKWCPVGICPTPNATGYPLY